MSLSRVGKMPIALPNGVNVDLQPTHVTIKGPKGELQTSFPTTVKITVEKDVIVITPADDTAQTKAAHGLIRALLANMVQGVSEGFSKELEVHGVGYRVNLAGKTLKMNLGYSHDIQFEIPEGIEISTQDNTITVKGISKQLVGQIAAKIRAYRKPEPYKGKGIRYKNEYIIRKSGKTAA